MYTCVWMHVCSTSSYCCCHLYQFQLSIQEKVGQEMVQAPWWTAVANKSTAWSLPMSGLQRLFQSKGGLSVDNCTKATPLTVSASQVSPVTSCAVTTRLDNCTNCDRCFKRKAGHHGHNCHRRQHRQNSADHRDFFILLSRMQEGFFSSSTRS